MYTHTMTDLRRVVHCVPRPRHQPYVQTSIWYRRTHHPDAVEHLRHGVIVS